MIPGAYDLYIRQGDTFDLILTVKNSDGTLLDLTGILARMQIRRSPYSAYKLVDLDSDEKGGITIDLVASTIKIRIDAEDTEALPAIAAAYDLELVNENNTVQTLLSGNVKIAKEVTR